MSGHRHRLHDDIHRTPDVSHISNPDVTHEESDVAVGPIAKFVFGLFVMCIVVSLLMWLLFNFFERRAQQAELPTSPLARQGAEALPPDPRLQAAPGFGVTLADGQRVDLSLKEPQAEYKVVREMWERDLTTYAWEDEAAGTVREPIEAAMARYLRRQQQQQTGAPGQAPAATGQQGQGGAGAAAPAGREEMPSGSSSGQQPERKHQ
jgi:hypothetical protein